MPSFLLFCAAACGSGAPVAEQAAAIDGAHPERAPAAMRRYGCTSCHTIPGVRGANSLVGPPLENLARRQYLAGRIPNRADWLMRWLMDPQQVKPGTAMPGMGVTEQDARDMAAFLYLN